jgi:3-oxoacyl-[acyl-carrier-protein] synthase II
MNERRVVVTGMGCVSPAGLGVATTWETLLAGRSVVRTIPGAVESGIQSTMGARVENFAPPPLKQDPSRLGRATLFALAASLEAVADAGLAGADIDLGRAGVIAATGIGDASEHVRQTKVFLERGLRAMHPLYIPKVMPNAAAAHVAIELGFRGLSFAPTSACAASAHGLALALRLIRAGDAELILAGGTEETFSMLQPLASFDALRALSRRNSDPEHASRPFDKDRDGFVLGEGAAMLVLETAEHAKRRGARVYAELRGAGMTTDSYHIVAPEPSGDGAIRAMRYAIADAGAAASDVNHISAHGTSTPLNDKVECVAINSLFGGHAKKIAVGAAKSVIGHTMGSAAAMSAIAAILAIRDSRVPPVANYVTPDPDCDLDIVAGAPRAMAVNVALVNAFGFGGHCVSLAIGSAEGL